MPPDQAIKLPTLYDERKLKWQISEHLRSLDLKGQLGYGVGSSAQACTAIPISLAPYQDFCLTTKITRKETQEVIQLFQRTSSPQALKANIGPLQKSLGEGCLHTYIVRIVSVNNGPCHQ